jgi:hypothetical protein
VGGFALIGFLQSHFLSECAIDEQRLTALLLMTASIVMTDDESLQKN